MKRHTNLLLILAVILLSILPLWWVDKPEPGSDGQVEEIFAGTDNKAKDLIGVISPDYKPWFSPILEPASAEIASLLFALQAAIGAGVIGYYLGASITREKLRRENQRPDKRKADSANAD